MIWEMPILLQKMEKEKSAPYYLQVIIYKLSFSPEFFQNVSLFFVMGNIPNAVGITFFFRGAITALAIGFSKCCNLHVIIVWFCCNCSIKLQNFNRF